MIDVNAPDFRDFCESTASHLEIVSQVTNGKIRGLDKLALNTLSQRKRLPAVVVNVLLVYFFNTFKNKVYDRKDLARVYDHWANKGVQTFSQAIGMTQVDIHEILQKKAPSS
ncbi:hypothetical protein [Peribacillus sp. SCS-155]|uniref:hypothetical protein n=1 Tax=Peribacillus sedimenti TaxID=3115297 RepID=UPI003906394A